MGIAGESDKRATVSAEQAGAGVRFFGFYFYYFAAVCPWRGGG